MVGRAVLTAVAVLAAGCSGASSAGHGSQATTHHVSPPPVSTPPPHVHRHARYRRPPQFVMISFDGSGDVALWRHWRAVSRRTGAHFSFFVSGVYLLDRASAGRYHPPRHRPGSSDIGFSPDAATVHGLVHQIDQGYAEGEEIGTHYNGHFCEPYPGNVETWSETDWIAEIEQFHDLMHDAGLTVPDGEIQGGRTPCLEGHLNVLYRALRREGMSYDTSHTANPGEWPQRIEGVWSFPLALIKLIGTPWDSLSMDYNFYVNQSNAHTVSRARSRVLARRAYASLMRYFRHNYHGNRAPIDVGNHFATWNHGAYVHALTRFVDAVCSRPEVRCVTYSTLVHWLDAQPPRFLARDRAGRFRAP
jgi:peptidoglycan/xylan/chitin deacetylase (PgdA/CDA1 family)